MDIVKKNLISIICGVIALICVVLIFYPLGGMYATIAAEVKKSRDTGDSLHKVYSEARTWPTLSSKDEDRQPLKGFPTEATIAAGEKITESWKTKTDQFVEAAVNIQRTALIPLVPGALPGGTGQQSIAYSFMDAYGKLMNATLANPNARMGQMAGMGGAGLQPGQAPPNADDVHPHPALNTPLIGRQPPTEAEIKARGDMDEYYIRRDMPVIINGVVSNQPAVEAEVIKKRGQVGDSLRASIAKESMVYFDPAVSFVASDKIVGNTVPQPNDIFTAQVGLWLQQEICRAIYDINAPAIAATKDDKGQTAGVPAAPIKRLIGIRFTLPYALPPAPAPGTPAPTDVPVVPPLPTAKVAADFVHNPLGQVSNDLYDVLPFNMALVCDAENLPTILTGLGRNRFLTIRSMDFQSVDAGVAYTQGYIYGDKPVVQINLRGQYLLLRKFAGQFMPPDIIRGLTLPAAGAAPAAG